MSQQKSNAIGGAPTDASPELPQAQYLLTYDLNTGRLTRVESVDSRTGDRHELSADALLRAYYAWYYTRLPWYYYHPFWYSVYQPTMAAK